MPSPSDPPLMVVTFCGACGQQMRTHEDRGPLLDARGMHMRTTWVTSPGGVWVPPQPAASLWGWEWSGRDADAFAKVIEREKLA